MSVNTYSHNLYVIDYVTRPDGKVNIRFSIMRAGIYYNLRFATRAFPPNDSIGFPMTPALGDPAHAQDPLIIVAPGTVLTYVWDAPADGYPSVNTSGWTFFIGYVDMYCCESDEPLPRPPEDDYSDDTSTPQAPPVDIPPPVGTPPPTVPPPDGGGDGATNTPTSPSPTGPGYSFPPPILPFEPPTWPGQTNGNNGTLLQNNGFAATTYVIGDRVFNYANGAWRDQFGNPIYVPADVIPPVLYQGTPKSIQYAQAAQAQSNFANTLEGSATPGQGTQVTADGVDGSPSLQATLSPSTVSTVIYTLPSSDGRLSISAEMFPYDAPIDVGAMIFAVITNTTQAPQDGIYAYVEALDSGGTRHTLADNTTIGTIPALGSTGLTICTDWISLLTGPVTIVITLMGPGGTPLVSKQLTGTALPPGAIPTPPVASPNLPVSVREAAWGTGAADIEAIYAGSYNALGEEDFYIIDVSSARVGIVVSITNEAKATGFKPVLRVFTEDDFTTPVLETSARFSVPDADKGSFAIGWRDYAQFPILTPGRYYLQVVHEAPFYSRRWGFKIFTREAPVSFSASLSGTGGLLGGTVTSGYGRQALKMLNTRTHAVLFAQSNSFGVADPESGASPLGSTMSVLPGDVVKVYRPGIGVQYKHIDLIGSTTVS